MPRADARVSREGKRRPVPRILSTLGTRCEDISEPGDSSPGAADPLRTRAKIARRAPEEDVTSTRHSLMPRNSHIFGRRTVTRPFPRFCPSLLRLLLLRQCLSFQMDPSTTSFLHKSRAFNPVRERVPFLPRRPTRREWEDAETRRLYFQG